MSPRYDLYVSRSSWLHRLDPRTKMAFVLVSFAMLLLNHQLALMAAYLVLVHVLLRLASVPWSHIGWVWRRMWAVSLMILVLWPLFYPGGEPVLLAWWRIRVTAPSLLQGLVSALRVVALAFSVFVLMASTDQSLMVQGLVGLGLPFEAGLALAIGLRYLPLLHGTYQTITDAQRARGWSPARRSLIQRARAYVPTLVALIIAALRLSDDLTLALASRGFQPGHPRSTRRPLRFRPADWWCLAGLSLLLVGAIALRVLLA
ncbi:MAG: energy-coupling factor transporter transmembrane component T [Anaerolineae bacterium]